MKACRLFIITSLLLIAACNNSRTGIAIGQTRQNGSTETYKPPLAGTTIVADSMRIKEDKLNNTFFSVRIVANEYSVRGTYTIAAAYGYNTGESMFTLPRGGSKLEPALRKGTAPYTYLVGFYYGAPKKFYEYYKVSAPNGNLEIKNTNAYSFQ